MHHPHLPVLIGHQGPDPHTNCHTLLRLLTALPNAEGVCVGMCGYVWVCVGMCGCARARVHKNVGVMVVAVMVVVVMVDKSRY